MAAKRKRAAKKASTNKRPKASTKATTRKKSAVKKKAAKKKASRKRATKKRGRGRPTDLPGGYTDMLPAAAATPAHRRMVERWQTRNGCRGLADAIREMIEHAHKATGGR